MTNETGQGLLVPNGETPHEALNQLLAADERNLAWLARRTGRSVSHLYRISIGERPISADMAAELAELFGVPVVTFLVGGDA